MTKEERAKKWFSNTPNADAIDMENRMKICSRVANKMLLVFLTVLIAECILLFMVSRGNIFNFLADFMNSISKGRYTSNHRKGVAIVGGIVCLPIIILPWIAAVALKKKWLQSEVEKLIGVTK